MESLGDKLKTVRESKGYTFDYIGRETNIATRYLEALETENFSVFPGEPYLLGFLRNYGEYLGLDVNELLSLYRAWKIQEQPIPVEQLLKSPSKLPKILLTVFLILAGVAVVGGGVYFFMNIPWKTNTAETAERSVVVYTLEGSFLEQRFYRGDSILIPLGGNQYKIVLFNLGEAVTIAAPMGNIILDLGQERSIDINSDGLDDIRVGVQDFVRNDPSMGVRLRFDINADMGIISEGIGGEEILPTAAIGLGNDSAANNPSNIKEIFKSANAYPFTLQASFQGYCMFRWEILRERDRQDRQEQYFVRTDELDIQAQNGIRIWVSNAMAVKLQVIVAGETKPLEIGGAGEVVVTDIRWVRDDDGRFRLAQIRID
ncbi:helix-turn-helix domain-containing protein [Treponema primitia]|uniref:helix-turn-helix domain-containing protein n=1 Tax=Treponema primitia TaxID=88058 RepID=UPI0002554D51|nr:helix-turn-helix domain-containing protein [Treponema primitia]